MSSPDSQVFESYVPVYDTCPDIWDEAKPFLVEQLKKITNSLNNKEIGFFLDLELLSGKSFYPGPNSTNEQTSEQFRSIFRKVIDIGAISVAGNPNTTPHGITVDANFTLIQLWASATNSTTFRSVTFSNPDTIYMDATNIYITSDNTYDRCNCIIEYLQEV